MQTLRLPPVLYLLHALGDSTKSLRLSSPVPFAIRTYFVSSVHKSASYLGEGIRFKQKPAFPSFSKFLEYLIQATASILKSSVDANLCLPPHLSPLPQSLPSRGREVLLISYGLYKSRLLKVFESFLIIF